jgi:pumilio RNA-binding family
MPEQTFPILEEIHQQTERLVQDQYGSYVIEHVLEHGHPDDKTKIISELRRKMLKYVKDQNANHVVQKCIEWVEPASLHFLVDAFKGQVSVIWG